jgi:AraC family transcriptional regulator
MIGIFVSVRSEVSIARLKERIAARIDQPAAGMIKAKEQEMVQDMRAAPTVRRDRPLPARRTAGQFLNEGWIHVERSTFQRADSYATENFLEFPGGFIEVRQFHWDRPLENVWTTNRRCYLLNMSLGADAAAEGMNLSAGRHRDPIAMGRMFMIPPGQTMQCRSTRGKSRSIRCVLDAALLESFLADQPGWEWDDRRLHQSLHLHSDQIEWLIRRMYREIRNPDFATPQVVESLAKQLAAEIVRKFELRRADRDYRVGGLAPWRMRLIGNRLRTGQAPPDLAELATLCDMTVRHLGRAFRTETGQTIGKYIESVMVMRANGMLVAGHAVRDVAASLGYSTSGGFATAFRRATGLLPSEVKPGGGQGGIGH